MTNELHTHNYMGKTSFSCRTFT